MPAIFSMSFRTNNLIGNCWVWTPMSHNLVKVCDRGSGPGHIARYRRDAGTTVFGPDLSAQMIEQARLRNPDMPFHEGDIMALDVPDGAGIATFYAIVSRSYS